MRVPQCFLPAATTRWRHWGKTARGALGRECTRLEVCNPLHSAYVASEALRYSVGLVECIALLTGMGRRDGGWVCRKFQVAQDLADDLTLRDDRNDPQRAISSAKTRCSSRAQLQRGDVGHASGSSRPCWRRVGMIAPRKWLCGAKQPP